MRDLVSCLSENSINVSNPSCSSYSNNQCITPSTHSLSSSTQTSVSCIYKLVLSTSKQIVVTVTWCRNHSNQGLTISFNNQDPSINTNSRFFRKKKGSKLIDFHDSKVTILWDLSNARYETSTSPEPLQFYYVVVVVDSELGLILGDSETIATKMKDSIPMAKVSLLSRREYCSSAWRNKGNQTIFVDGLLVDLLWDVHDWFFNSSSGSSSSSGVFMFRTRSGLDSRLWLEEKNSHKDKDRIEFSFFIYASTLTCVYDSMAPPFSTSLILIQYKLLPATLWVHVLYMHILNK
ncbi:unnamed protein product [Vicia faba]|uniref:Uncharacterized protein n=1 Tax=Vicia faba TaxID=3906 RepID=A0AAV1B138_VICFA|nr:unnamed protein product [Vicia faba]